MTSQPLVDPLDIPQGVFQFCALQIKVIHDFRFGGSLGKLREHAVKLRIWQMAGWQSF